MAPTRTATLVASPLALATLTTLAAAQTFAPEVTAMSGASGANCVVTGDINGDTGIDLIVTENSAGRISWVRRTVAGFAPAETIASGLNSPWHSAAGDLDGDGDVDVLSAARNNDEVSWYENIGSPTNMPKHLLGLHNTPFQAETADLDDDGDLDIFIAVSSDSDVIMYRGLGGGLFEPAFLVDAQATGSRYVHLADMDGDDDPDVLSANFSSSDVTYYENLSPTKKPKLFEADGLHCVDAGSVTLTGKNFLGTTAQVDGQPVPVANVTEARLDLVLGPDIPGGLHEVALTNVFGTTVWPDALRRYPVVELPATASLGEPVQMVIDNGEPGVFVLAYSGAVWPSPAPFHSFGWYHGLELDGVWMLTSGAFTVAEPEKTLSFPGVSVPALAGIPIHLQAWTAQTDSGHEGFTAVTTIVFE